MPIQLEIDDTHVQLLIDFYVSRLKVLRDEILDRERETKEINANIQKLKKKNIPLLSANTNANGTVIPKVYYSAKWPWTKKIQFALEMAQKPLTTKEIVDTLSEYEPTFLFERKRAIASISSILSTKSGHDKEFLKVSSESGDFAYDINSQNQADVQEPIEDLPF